MVKNYFSRRDFLKLLALVPGAITVRPLAKLAQNSGKPQPHIIIIVYDAWSARNTSLYGYPRNTMPNLEKFARKALVYHRHYSSAIFTVPGTASILTGLYPWSHRALSLGGRISYEHQQHQIFNLLNNNFDTLGYAQNKYADLFLYQSGDALKKHIPNYQFNLDRRLLYSLPIFDKDSYVAFSSFDDNIFQEQKGFDGSLFLGPVFRTLTQRSRYDSQKINKGSYAGGHVPDSTEQFLLADIVDGAIKILSDLHQPSVVYIHFFPPHSPYRPTKKFIGHFSKGPETLKAKPIHSLSVSKVDYKHSKLKNLEYDKYLASWDEETGRLYQFIEESGLKKNSYIFITSDHGEFFERGEQGHSTVLLSQPVVHVPLIVSKPGYDDQKNIFQNTSSVDLLPTLADIAGLSKPDWSEGVILPELGGTVKVDRAVFSFESRKSSAFLPLQNFSISITKNQKRLLHYQYNGVKQLELYDLEEDPEEMHNLQKEHPSFGIHLEEELNDKISSHISNSIK